MEYHCLEFKTQTSRNIIFLETSCISEPPGVGFDRESSLSLLMIWAGTSTMKSRILFKQNCAKKCNEIRLYSMNEWPIVEPKNLDITGRELLTPNWTNYVLTSMGYILIDITIVENNIAKRKIRSRCSGTMAVERWFAVVRHKPTNRRDRCIKPITGNPELAEAAEPRNWQ